MGKKVAVLISSNVFCFSVLPSFIIEPNDQTVIEMGIATFKCSATGNPVPQVTWIKDGITVASGDTLSFVAYRNKSGEYWCSADNGLRQAENSSAHLYVHCKYTVSLKFHTMRQR